MNNLLIQSATILHPGNKMHGKVADILVLDGKISEIGKGIKTSAKNTTIIDAKNQYFSAGFFDLNVNFGDPGLESKEDLITGTSAAAAGGFTGLALMPNTQPPIHSKAEVAYLVNRSKNYLVDIYPLGCISHNCEGKELAEMYDMQQTGAVAFTDGKKPVSNAGLMSRALLYTKSFKGLIFSHAEDQDIAGKAKMNEGVMSTYLGMKGNPSLAEELMISRDIYLAEYNDAPIHFSTISAAGSVDLIRKAKKAGVKVSCDVAAHALVLTEDLLEGFDSNYKVKPPLRTRADQKALISGLKDGTIDAIVSQHTPHEIEFKNVEFEIASYGITGLQTALPLALKAGLSPEQIVEKMAVNPRKILGLQYPDLEVGLPANFILFDPSEEWTFDEKTNYSRSENSPFMGKKLTGKIKLAYNNAQYFTY
ncbi:dihydroorotase [Daejeonella lutea]|uniref:Dihydroorotase n=1 Tax=Daejeonella lutea TaxID=572036 RepID=A0A1T5EX98_9SPHI|nr:dihydroorotase [Daejeonella lutea]SKB88572.1 dihydroorotase [Daejeonella lutea]